MPHNKYILKFLVLASGSLILGFSTCNEYIIIKRSLQVTCLEMHSLDGYLIRHSKCGDWGSNPTEPVFCLNLIFEIFDTVR
jgi:hypothetical protein